MKGDKPKVTKTPVKGGWIGRDPETGRFIQAQGSKGTARSRPESESAAREASSRRHSALKRLADR